MSNMIYSPIRKKIEEWIRYDEHSPKGNYYDNPEKYDEYRRWYDRDCVLTCGELKADTMFSLWTPLRNTIIRINSPEKIQEIGNIRSKYVFIRELIKEDNIEKLLPAELSIVAKLSKLFELGMGRENVFLLPNRELNTARARRPYNDYIPVFLLESFQGGKFADYWNSNEEHLQWIKDEHFEVFFDGEIAPENIKDLSGAGNIRETFPADSVEAMEYMIDNYIEILQERKKCFAPEEIENALELEKIMEQDWKVQDFQERLKADEAEAVQQLQIIMNDWFDK